MATVQDLIESSFRLIGAIVAGESLETNELNDAFVSLNQMLASWNTEGASLVARQRLTIPVASSNQYALPTRPIRIESASVASGGIDSPLEIVDSVGWEATPEKQATSVYVQKLYCDYAYPSSTVYIAPIPRLGGMLEMWIYTAITQFASLAQTIDLPPGYEAAIRFNLAVLLEPENPRSQIDPLVTSQAQNFKASIVQLNASNHIKTAQPAAATLAAQ